MDANPIRHIALIGFGEVGGIFGRDFAAGGLRVSVFDILLGRRRRARPRWRRQKKPACAPTIARKKRFAARIW